MSSFSIARRLKSFGYAIWGILLLIATQHNAWIHFASTSAVLALGIRCQIDKFDWCLVTFSVGFVWVTEAFNTALELLADEVSQEHRIRIGQAKDLGAGAVLISAITA